MFDSTINWFKDRIGVEDEKEKSEYDFSAPHTPQKPDNSFTKDKMNSSDTSDSKCSRSAVVIFIIYDTFNYLQ